MYQIFMAIVAYRFFSWLFSSIWNLLRFGFSLIFNILRSIPHWSRMLSLKINQMRKN